MAQKALWTIENIDFNRIEWRDKKDDTEKMWIEAAAVAASMRELGRYIENQGINQDPEERKKK